MRRVILTKNGVNLSDWNKTQESIPGNEIFGVYLKKTEPEEWEILMRVSQAVLDSKFQFLKEWRLDDDNVLDNARILLSGGIIAEHNFDYRIASVFAANILIKE